jgi:hypothetical protein
MPPDPAFPFLPTGSLSDAQIDALMAHPHWESLGPEIDALAAHNPPTTQRADRTTVLTWIYQRQGVASFEELSEKLTGMSSVPKRKKHLRQALRAMERMLLVGIVNFPGDEDDAPEPDEDVVGRSSLVSLTWTGMLWLRRAWTARERLARHRAIELVHRELVAEEDESGWADPYWVENVCRAHSQGEAPCAQEVAPALPAITSIFDLARKTPSS